MVMVGEVGFCVDVYVFCFFELVGGGSEIS